MSKNMLQDVCQLFIEAERMADDLKEIARKQGKYRWGEDKEPYDNIKNCREHLSKTCKYLFSLSKYLIKERDLEIGTSDYEKIYISGRDRKVIAYQVLPKFVNLRKKFGGDNNE